MDSNDKQSSESSIPIESGEVSGSLSLADVPFEHRNSVNKSSTSLATGAQSGTSPIEEKDVPVEPEDYEENMNMHDVDVENGDAFPSTNVEEIESTSQTSATRRGLMSLFCLVLLGLVIGISVGVSGRRNKDESSSAAMTDSSGSTISTGSSSSAGGSSPTPTGPTTGSDGGAPAPPPAPTSAPAAPTSATPARAATVQQVIEFLIQQGAGDGVKLMNSDTPQYKAVLFLAEQDDANLPVPNINNRRMANDDADTTYLYLVRYAMSVIYFAMNGPNWFTQMNFMSPAPVCNWYGDSFSFDPDWPMGMPTVGGLLCANNTPMVLDLGTWLALIIFYLSVQVVVA